MVLLLFFMCSESLARFAYLCFLHQASNRHLSDQEVWTSRHWSLIDSDSVADFHLESLLSGSFFRAISLVEDDC